MKVAYKLRIALPCLLIGAAIGALVGGSFGHTIVGIRVGIIAGGVAAFVYTSEVTRRKK